jgi:hypothetical protein
LRTIEEASPTSSDSESPTLSEPFSRSSQFQVREDEDPSSDVTILSGEPKLEKHKHSPPPAPCLAVTNCQLSDNNDNEDIIEIPFIAPSHSVQEDSLLWTSESDSSSDEAMKLELNVAPEVSSKASPDAEAIFLEKMREARRVYQEMVESALKELRKENPPGSVISEPPEVDKMTNAELEEELAGFGFRFTTRESAISKIVRCWVAKNNCRTNAIDVVNPVDFIRFKSQYYESILIYQPIPLAAMYREMVSAGVKISVHGLKRLLDEEGVAFLGEPRK